MRWVEVNGEMLRVPNGWTRFLHGGVLYDVNDDGTVLVVPHYDVEREDAEQQAEEEAARLLDEHERSLHPREKW